MWTLCVACAALMVRNLVRTVQFGAGQTADINTKEVYIYVFDAFPMFLAMLVLIVFHPGLLIKNARRARKVVDFSQPLAGDRGSGQVPLMEYRPAPLS